MRGTRKFSGIQSGEIFGFSSADTGQTMPVIIEPASKYEDGTGATFGKWVQDRKAHALRCESEQ